MTSRRAFSSSWTMVPSEDSETLLKVGIYDKHASSSVVRVNGSTTANDICENILNKISRVSKDASEKKYFSLIFVCSFPVNNRVFYCIRTLYPKELVLPVMKKVISSQCKKFNLPLETMSSKWYFKDIRTAPLEFGENGEVSGDSSSEGEREISPGDASYLREQNGVRKAVLLRKSTKDPNLWKKREVILSDKLWCLNSKGGDKHKVFSLNLQGNIVVGDSFPGFDYPHSIVIRIGSLQFSPSSNPFTSNALLVLRANSDSEQRMWIEEIRWLVGMNTDNDIIHMGEVIMGDEGSSQWHRIWRPQKNLFSQVIDGVLHHEFCELQLDCCKSPLESTSSHICNTDPTNEIIRNISNNGEQTKMKRSKSLDFSEKLNEMSSNKEKVSSIQKDQIGEKSDNSAKKHPKILLPCRRNICRLPNRSLVHSFHRQDPLLADMMNFLLDVSRYQELFRREIFASSRHQWQAVMRIYQKYILPQISIMGKLQEQKNDHVQMLRAFQSLHSKRKSTARRLSFSNSSKASINANDNGSSMTSDMLDINIADNAVSASAPSTPSRSVMKDKFAQRKLRELHLTIQDSSEGSFSNSFTSNGSSFLPLSRRVSESRLSSGEGSKDDIFIEHSSDNVSSTSMASSDTTGSLEELFPDWSYCWKVSSDSLLSLHKKIFANVRRQIAGIYDNTGIVSPSKSPTKSPNKSSMSSVSPGLSGRRRSVSNVPVVVSNSSNYIENILSLQEEDPLVANDSSFTDNVMRSESGKSNSENSSNSESRSPNDGDQYQRVAPPSQSSSISSWFWSSFSSQVASSNNGNNSNGNSNPATISNNVASASTWKHEEKDFLNNPNIEEEELIPRSSWSSMMETTDNYSHSNWSSNSSYANSSSTTSNSKYLRGPMYQIIDLKIRPSAQLFEELTLEVEDSVEEIYRLKYSGSFDRIAHNFS